MSQSLKQSIFFSILLTLLNLGSKTILYFYWPEWRVPELSTTILISVWLGLLYWGTCQIWKGRFRLWLLPAARIVFWTIIVADGFLRHSRMVSEDFLYANNEDFAAWILVKQLLNLREVNEILELVLEDILFIALLEWLVIILAIRFFPSTKRSDLAIN